MALTGNETLQVLGQDKTGANAATTQTVTTSQIAALAGDFSGDSVAAVTTVGAGTLTAANLTDGLINRTGPTSAFTDTTDTAAALYAAVGSNTAASFYVRIKNATAFAETLQGGTGVTFSSAVIVPPLSVGTYLVTFTSATAAVFNHVQTVPLNTIAPATQYAALTNTTGFTIAAAANEAGAADCTLNLTGTLGGNANVQSDTATNIVAAIPNARVGTSYKFRLINSSSANFAWTLTTNTGLTLTGTMSVAQNTWRDFYVTVTTLTAVTIQSIGTGTYS